MSSQTTSVMVHASLLGRAQTILGNVQLNLLYSSRSIRKSILLLQ